MVTLVGTQNEFSDAVKELLELDYDAVEAYKSAIERIANTQYQSMLTSFKEDHERHIVELTDLLITHNIEPPKGTSGKVLLAKGKVILADLVGDKAILFAMKTNEDDTNTAYERLNEHKYKWPDAELILQKGLEDERRHRAWIESILEKEK